MDGVHEALVSRWLAAGESYRFLKTDLFEEAVGNGLYPLLKECPRAAIGMDVSWRVAAAACSRRQNLRGIAADSRRLPFADSSFDGIISISTFDHFSSKEGLTRSLDEIARVLRPGGILILTLDNPANPIIALRQRLPFALLNRLKLVPYYIGYTCGPGRLQRILVEAGFEITEMAAVAHVPRVFAIPLARWVDRHGTPRSRAWLGRTLRRFECLARWPTRYGTGHFTAVRAVRKGAQKMMTPPSRECGENQPACGAHPRTGNDSLLCRRSAGAYRPGGD
jgi:SAM-dependent methyltransferase